MIATSVSRNDQRVSSTNSLRMLVAVSKPIRGRNNPKARRAVTPVWRNACCMAGRLVDGGAALGISHLLDVGAAEDALRQEDHHDGEDREGGNVLVGAGDVLRP